MSRVCRGRQTQWVKPAIAAKAKDPLLAKMIRWLDLTQAGRPALRDAELLARIRLPLLGALRANAERAMPRGLSCEVVGGSTTASRHGGRAMRLARPVDRGLDDLGRRGAPRWIENDMTARGA